MVLGGGENVGGELASPLVRAKFCEPAGYVLCPRRLVSGYARAESRGLEQTLLVHSTARAFVAGHTEADRLLALDDPVRGMARHQGTADGLGSGAPLAAEN